MRLLTFIVRVVQCDEGEPIGEQRLERVLVENYKGELFDDQPGVVDVTYLPDASHRIAATPDPDLDDDVAVREWEKQGYALLFGLKYGPMKTGH